MDSTADVSKWNAQPSDNRRLVVELRRLHIVSPVQALLSKAELEFSEAVGISPLMPN